MCGKNNCGYHHVEPPLEVGTLYPGHHVYYIKYIKYLLNSVELNIAIREDEEDWCVFDIVLLLIDYIFKELE